MVNETPDAARMGWSGTLWCTLMYVSAIFAFCAISSPSKLAVINNRPQLFGRISLVLRIMGFISLTWLAFAFRGEDGHAIITLRPFSLHTEWYGILGLIGWAYLMGAIVFLIFRTSRTALLGCMVLLMCLYPANRKGAFNGFWLSDYINIGEAIGSQAAITVSGMLLAAMLLNRDTTAVWPRARFTLWFIAGCAAAALLAHRLYGISKNDATPSWCLWASAITAAVWLVFYYICDVRGFGVIPRTLAAAGQNVLLAYLISEMAPSAFELLHWDEFYDSFAQPTIFNAVARSAGLATVILFATIKLNRAGFRLKL
jgi:heparan-alpha-glucosaminide N-acetyltransferase